MVALDRPLVAGQYMGAPDVASQEPLLGSSSDFPLTHHEIPW